MNCSASSWHNDDNFVLEISTDEEEASVIIEEIIDHENDGNIWRRNGMCETKNKLDDESESFIAKHESSDTLEETRQENSLILENDDFSEKMINLSKLISQLFNARVVIEKIRKSAPIGDEITEKECVPISNEPQAAPKDIKDLVQFYCVKCKTVKMESHRVSRKKACPNCQTTMKYLCSKCNNKLYASYVGYKDHWPVCGVTGIPWNKLKPSDLNQVNLDFSSAVIRYCSTCKRKPITIYNCKKLQCKNCTSYLGYQCIKCKAHYQEYQQIVHHLHSKCYPSHYKCNQCDYTSPLWVTMRQHLAKNVHRVGSESRLSEGDSDSMGEELMTKHVDIRGTELHCKWCAFKTTNSNSLRCHLSAIHSEHSNKR